MRRWRLVLAALVALLVLLELSAALMGTGAGSWHVDPLTVARTGKPNDYLAAPPGLTATPPDRAVPVFAETPEALLARFDAIARAAPRVQVVVDGQPSTPWATYVQRSAVFRFPDTISVRAVAVPGGASLVVYSRARYGYSDLGVNRARVDGWLAQLGTP